MPSFTAYSWLQLPHTSLPLAIAVSMSKVWRSLSVWDGSPLSSASSSGAGVSAGRFGRPSYRGCDQQDGLLIAKKGSIRGHTSFANVFMASQSNLGSMFLMKTGFSSISTCSSSASFGCSGKASALDLHVLRAHVKKLSVRSFIFAGVRVSRRGLHCCEKGFASSKRKLRPADGQSPFGP